MKSIMIPLASHDALARNHIIENLKMGAIEHTLTKKLLPIFLANEEGDYSLIAFENIDLEEISDFDHDATYNGKAFSRKELPPIGPNDYPISLLTQYISDYLKVDVNSLVICENWAWKRTHAIRLPRDSRFSFFKEEVYHILTPSDTNQNFIENSLREADNHWAIGVCSTTKTIPEIEIANDLFFNAIVDNCKHIFTPALNGGGYLIWSKKLP